MALVVSVITRQIQAIFDRRLSSGNDIGNQIANAYRDYAKLAQGPQADFVTLLGTEQTNIANAIAALISGKLPAPEAAAQIAQAMTAFWLLPPVHTVTGGTCSSIFTAAGQARLAATRADTTSVAAASLAAGLDTMTRTVIVAYPTFSPGPLF